MIRKLESAGLGFYIKATETHQKLGKLKDFQKTASYNYYFVGNIPLRQLVYRVLDIPRSMRPFVYDFGVLHEDAEIIYVNKIVCNHVRKAILYTRWYFSHTF
jgi:hypothetical protein